MGAVQRLQTLVVDDCRPMRTLMREMLRAFGVERCFECATAAEAAELLRTRRFDLVITDLMLGGEDGISLLRRLRGNTLDADPATPVIVMSGHAALPIVRKALDAGANSFLAKPVSARALACHLAFVLDGHGAAMTADGQFFNG